jgi:hypothetical protein
MASPEGSSNDDIKKVSWKLKRFKSFKEPKNCEGNGARQESIIVVAHGLS